MKLHVPQSESYTLRFIHESNKTRSTSLTEGFLAVCLGDYLFETDLALESNGITVFKPFDPQLWILALARKISVPFDPNFKANFVVDSNPHNALFDTALYLCSAIQAYQLDEREELVKLSLFLTNDLVDVLSRLYAFHGFTSYAVFKVFQAMYSKELPLLDVVTDKEAFVRAAL